MDKYSFRGAKGFINRMLTYNKDKEDTKSYLEGYIDCLLDNELAEEEEYTKLNSYLRTKVREKQ